MSRSSKGDGWIEGALDFDPKEEFDFDEGLPSTAEPSTTNKRERRRSRSQTDKSIPLGEGRYRDEFNFEEGLPEVKARVQIAKAAAEDNTEEELERAPIRIHKGGKVETQVSTSATSQNNTATNDVSPKVAPKPEKATNHVHSFTVDGKQAFTGKELVTKPGFHNHVLGAVKTSDAKDGGNHTHTVGIGGKKFSSSGPTVKPVKTRSKPKETAKAEDVKKRIVQRTRDGKTVFCVESETTGKSFGCYPTKAQAAERLRQVEGFSKQAPQEGMNNEQLRSARAARSKQFGIEILEVGSNLSFPKGFPTKLELYGDPVNLKYPLESVERARNARVRFKQFAKNYKQTQSKKVIHERIVRAEMKFGVKPSVDPKDPLDALLPASLKKSIEFGLLPDVLTWEAVREGTIPELGESGLPRSLEPDVPPRFRYWKCDTEEEARRVRDALVEERLFTSETVKSVDGETRRAVIETVQKLFLPPSYDPEELVEIPPIVRPVDKVASFLEPTSDERATVLFDEDIVETVGIETILEKTRKLAGEFVIAAYDSPEVRKMINGPAFQLKSRDDLVFVTNAKLENEELITWVQLERATELVKFAFGEERSIRFFKADDGEEERTVFGIVLEPDEVDAQGDTISAEEIKQACYKFMEDFGNLGRQHKELVNGKLKLLENYIAPVDFQTEEGEHVKKGTWLMKERVVDDQLWKAAKKGEYTGFSIGGSGVRVPL